MKQYNSITVVMVLYFPDPDVLRENLLKLSVLGCNLVIYENTNNPDVVLHNNELIHSSCVSCKLLGGSGNDGLSMPFNLIVDMEWDNSEAFFFLDQDTLVEVETLIRLFDDFIKNHLLHNIAIMAGIPIKKTGAAYRTKRIDNLPFLSGFSEVKSVPSSFSIISKHALNVVGKFQQDFFIDYIDIDMSLRCRQSGMRIVVNENCTFIHDVGEGSIAIFGVHLTPISSPLRHYYQVRNSLLSFKRNRASFFRFIMLLSKRFITVTLNSIIDLKSFRVRFYYYFLGVMHGFKGKSGKL